ncbi:MAG: hypothetical protein KC468_14615 [Myxococcales bacterium]|nr:hypothetical protein [Myxococcales bacterium]
MFIDAVKGRRAAAITGFAGALGVLSALALPSGCGGTCGEYVDCPSRPGLRYVDCGDRFEFNDSTTKSTEKDAVDYCYCNIKPLECANGREANFCNTATLDGDPLIWIGSDDGVDLAEGAAECLDYSGGCRISVDGCNYLGWYLACADEGSGRYVGADGTLYDSSKAAISSCYVEPPFGEEGFLSFERAACEVAIDDCDAIACESSDACVDDARGECRDAPACWRHEDEMSCTRDEACRWE